MSDEIFHGAVAAFLLAVLVLFVRYVSGAA
jgi:hypothetical protein